MAHQTLRIQWFGNTWVTKLEQQWCEGRWLTKRYVYKGLKTHGFPNCTNTMVCWLAAYQTLLIHCFGDAWLTKPYKYTALIAQGSPSVTYTMVGDALLTKLYK